MEKYTDAKKEYDLKRQLLIKEIDNRVLVRPATNYKTIIIYVVILVLGLLSLGLASILIPLLAIYKIIVFLTSSFIFLSIFIRFFAIKCIECYQHYGDETIRKGCRCSPSCSEYSILVLKKYPLIIAFFKIRKRINKTCNGIDYIRDNP